MSPTASILNGDLDSVGVSAAWGQADEELEAVRTSPERQAATPALDVEMQVTTPVEQRTVEEAAFSEQDEEDEDDSVESVAKSPRGLALTRKGTIDWDRVRDVTTAGTLPRDVLLPVDSNQPSGKV